MSKTYNMLSVYTGRRAHFLSTAVTLKHRTASHRIDRMLAPPMSSLDSMASQREIKDIRTRCPCRSPPRRLLIRTSPCRVLAQCSAHGSRTPCST